MNRNALLEKARETARSIFADCRITLFGLCAQGQERPESDWDTLILLPHELNAAIKRQMRHARLPQRARRGHYAAMDDRTCLIQHRMSGAWRTLDTARRMLSGDDLERVVNRIYYACRCAAIALLDTRNLDTSRHSAVRSLLARHVVPSGAPDKNPARHLMKHSTSAGQRLRRLFEPQREEVETRRAEATESVTEIQAYLDQHIFNV